MLLPPQSAHAFSPASYSLPMQHQPTYPTPLLSKPQSSCQPKQAVSSASTPANPSRKRTHDETFDESLEALHGTPWKVPSDCSVLSESCEGDDPTLPIDNMDTTSTITGDDFPSRNQSTTRFGTQLDTEIEAAADVAVPQAVGQGQILAEPSRKVRRRDRSSSRELMTGNASDSDWLPKSCPEDPPIDESTHLLGIGWALIGEDRDVQAASRGWAKYIENHYPFSTAKIILQSKGLEALLVETNQGYHLFNEDLSEGKLVSVTWQACLANLQCSPAVFEGLTTLKAVRKNSGTFSKTDCGDKPSLDANFSNWSTDFEMSMD